MRTIISILLLFALVPHTDAQTAYNLIANGRFNFNSPNIYTDTAFGSQNGCWIPANDNPLEILPLSYEYLNRDSNRSIGVVRHGSQSIWFIQPLPPVLKSDTSFTDTPASGSAAKRTYAATKLVSPLVAGTTYAFSMDVHGIQFRYAIDSIKFPDGRPFYGIFQSMLSNMEVAITDIKLADYSTSGRLNYTPQIKFSGWHFPKTDTSSFVTLTATFTAMGGEQYLTIGNFDHYSEFKFAAPNFSLSLDTLIGGYSQLMVTNISLLADTTKPFVSLDSFSLGPDRLQCGEQPFTIGGPAGFFHYFWNTGDTSRTITVSQPGTYWCAADYGCSVYIDTLTILSPKPLPSSEFLGPDTVVCNDESIVISAPAGFAYRWSGGDTLQSVRLSQAGQYICTLFNGCDSVSDRIDIRSLISPPPGKIISGSDRLCANGTLTPVRLTAASAQSLLWSNGDTTRYISTAMPGWVWVKESNACGTNLDSIYLRGCPVKLFFPTAFSPNGDGLNEAFGPSSAFLKDLSRYKMQVFDRWGNRVFSATDPHERWQPNDAAQGVYSFYCEYSDLSKEPQKISGTIMLFR